MSDSNRTTVALVKQTAFGAFNAPNHLKQQRFTKEALEFDKETVRSEEIRPDRNMAEAVKVGIGSKGTIDFEMAIGDFDGLLEAALASAFSGTTLINGTTRPAFTIEKKFTLAATSSFMTFRDMCVDQMTLNLTAKQIVTGQFSFLGTTVTEGTATTDTSGTYTEPGTGLLLSASANVANVEADGDAITAVKSLTLTVANNLRTKDVIGKEEADDIGQGSFSVTGRLDAYFNDRTLLGKFIDHSGVEIKFDLTREAADAQVGDLIGYRFTLPRVRFTKGNPTVPGQNQDIMLPLEFAAELSDGAQAAQTLTLSANFSNAETIVIGGKTYTAQTVLTNVDGNFQIGASASDSIDNLIAAINLSGIAGTQYAAAMTIHPTASAAAGAGDTMVATANAKGTAGNAIATTETSATAAWGAATMTGGEDIYTLMIEKLLKTA